MRGYDLICPYPHIGHSGSQADGLTFKSIYKCKSCVDRKCNSDFKNIKKELIKEEVCQFDVNFIRATTSLGPIVINGYISSNRVEEYPRKKKNSVRPHAIDGQEILAWISKLEVEIQSLRSQLDSETQRQLNLIHDLHPAVNSVLRSTEELIKIRSKGQNIETFLDGHNSTKEEKTLYKSVEFLTERISLIKLFINPDAITIGKKGSCEIYKLIHKIKFLFDPVANPNRIRLVIVGSCSHSLLVYKSFSALFLSLIDNAIKYSPENQDIEIKLSDDGTILYVDVISIGPSFSPQNRDKLFEKNFRDPSARQAVADGQGLGLFLAKKIADAHGGWINAYNEGYKMTLNGIDYASIRFRCGFVVGK